MTILCPFCSLSQAEVGSFTARTSAEVQKCRKRSRRQKTTTQSLKHTSNVQTDAKPATLPYSGVVRSHSHRHNDLWLLMFCLHSSLFIIIFFRSLPLLFFSARVATIRERHIFAIISFFLLLLLRLLPMAVSVFFL